MTDRIYDRLMPFLLIILFVMSCSPPQKSPRDTALDQMKAEAAKAEMIELCNEIGSDWTPIRTSEHHKELDGLIDARVVECRQNDRIKARECRVVMAIRMEVEK